MTGVEAELKSKATEEGFDAVGICRPTDIPAAAKRLAAFLDSGHHGQMEWMARRSEWRGNPAALWQEARSVVMLAESYAAESDPLATLEQRDRATISVYARNTDYHKIVKQRLKQLGRWLISRLPGSEIKVFVDTAPVMEKPLAEAAGLGWQGKHTNLVSRVLGNWFFLGAIFTTAELEPDSSAPDLCGSCRRCLDICPTDAFPAPYRLDARKCISYLTIEHRGPVDLALRSKMGNRVFGCDDCLAVCPWNKFAQVARETRYHAKPELEAPELAALASLDDEGFRSMFQGGPVRRIGRNRLLRNVLYAIGNSSNPDLAPAAARHAGDSDPAVADAAVWAASRLQEAKRQPIQTEGPEQTREPQ